MVRRQLAYLFLGVLALSCGNNLDPRANISGAWAADHLFPGSSLVLDLAQPGAGITGSGTYTTEAGPSGTLQVSGSYTPPRVRLALRFDFGLTRKYDATVLDSHQMSGELSDSTGFTEALTFIRQ